MIASKITLSILLTGPSSISSSYNGLAFGCFSCSSSRDSLFIGRMEPTERSSFNNLRAGLILPEIIKFLNRLAFSSIELSEYVYAGILRWIASPSLTKASILPDFHKSSLLFKVSLLSLLLAVLLVFCSSKFGIIVIAMKAISRTDVF